MSHDKNTIAHTRLALVWQPGQPLLGRPALLLLAAAIGPDIAECPACSANWPPLAPCASTAGWARLPLALVEGEPETFTSGSM